MLKSCTTSYQIKHYQTSQTLQRMWQSSYQHRISAMNSTNCSSLFILLGVAVSLWPHSHLPSFIPRLSEWMALNDWIQNALKFMFVCWSKAWQNLWVLEDLPWLPQFLMLRAMMKAANKAPLTGGIFLLFPINHSNFHRLPQIILICY